MPGGMKDLLGEVNRVHVDLVLLAVLTVDPGCHLVLGSIHTLGFECALIGLKCNVRLTVATIDIKVVVVRSCQHMTITDME